MSERYVWIDPGRKGGQPCVGGRRLPVKLLAGSVWAGYPVEEAAQQYDVTVPQVLVACWYVAVYGSRAWRKRWGSWAKEAHLALYDEATPTDQCPRPPSKEQPS